LGPYDLRDICRTLVEEQSLQQGRTITLELPSLPVTVQMDRDYLKQVIATVLRQALTCSSPDGVVQVSISQHERQILIQVRDAESDPAQDQEQYATGSCTEPLLVDAHPVSSDDTDLWLVICKTIVEWYSGRIWYTASSDGKGYMCTIELPQDA